MYDIPLEYKEHIRRVLSGDGWRVIMTVIGSRLAHYESIMQQSSREESVLIEVLTRRNELLHFVQALYHLCEELSPFDVSAQALWTTRLKLPEISSEPPVAFSRDMPMPVGGTRQGGGIA